MQTFRAGDSESFLERAEQIAGQLTGPTAELLIHQSAMTAAVRMRLTGL